MVDVSRTRSALLVAEQLALGQALGQRRAVHRHERVPGPRAAIVQLPGHQFLAGAAVAEDQGGAGNGRQLVDALAQILHGAAVADERRVVAGVTAKRAHLRLQAGELHRLLHLRHHALEGLVLRHEGVGAHLHRARAAVEAARAGVDDDRRLQAAALHLRQHLEAVHVRHLQVQDHAVHGLGLQGLDAGAAAVGLAHVEAAEALEVVGVLLAHGGDVVDDQDQGHPSASAAGKVMVMVVPRPGALSTCRWPPASPARRRTLLRPRPVPPLRVV
jgi:hypothetical protein